MDETDRRQGVCAVGGCKWLGGEKMYIPEIVVGVFIGAVLTVALIVIAASMHGKKKGGKGDE